MFPFQIMLAILCGWLQREQESVIAFLREENRVLKAQLAGRRLRLDDSERRPLAELGYRLALPSTALGQVDPHQILHVFSEHVGPLSLPRSA